MESVESLAQAQASLVACQTTLQGSVESLSNQKTVANHQQRELVDNLRGQQSCISDQLEFLSDGMDGLEANPSLSPYSNPTGIAIKPIASTMQSGNPSFMLEEDLNIYGPRGSSGFAAPLMRSVRIRQRMNQSSFLHPSSSVLPSLSLTSEPSPPLSHQGESRLPETYAMLAPASRRLPETKRLAYVSGLQGAQREPYSGDQRGETEHLSSSCTGLQVRYSTTLIMLKELVNSHCKDIADD